MAIGSRRTPGVPPVIREDEVYSNTFEGHHSHAENTKDTRVAAVLEWCQYVSQLSRTKNRMP